MEQIFPSERLLPHNVFLFYLHIYVTPTTQWLWQRLVPCCHVPPITNTSPILSCKRRLCYNFHKSPLWLLWNVHNVNHCYFISLSIFTIYITLTYNYNPFGHKIDWDWIKASGQLISSHILEPDKLSHGDEYDILAWLTRLAQSTVLGYRTCSMHVIYEHEDTS